MVAMAPAEIAVPLSAEARAVWRGAGDRARRIGEESPLRYGWLDRHGGNVGAGAWRQAVSWEHNRESAGNSGPRNMR